MSFRPRFIPVLVFLAALCSAVGYAQTVSAGTDRDVINRLCDSAMVHVAAELRTYRSTAVIAANDTFSRFYAPELRYTLARKGVEIRSGGDSVDAQVTFSVKKIDVAYSEVFTLSWFGERLTERTVSVVIAATITSGVPGIPLKALETSSTSVDTVPYRMTIADPLGTLPTTAFRAPELPFTYSLLEPFIVTVASGVAIYLFFTIRS